MNLDRTPNVELLDLVLKTIHTDLDHWSQTSWRTIEDETYDDVQSDRVYPTTCDTAYCFAGWAIQLGSVNTPQWLSDGTLRTDPVDDPEEYDEGAPHVAASDRASRLLGISQWSSLFEARNTLEMLDWKVDKLKNGVRV